MAEALKAKNLSLRQIASIVGIANSTLHDWLRKRPISDDDLEASSPQRRKLCGLCGNWIKKGAQPLWFHPSCHDKVVDLLEKVRSEENEEACQARTASQLKEEGGENVG